MASAYIVRRRTPRGELRYVVRYRLGGRWARPTYAGIFRTMREARARRDYIAGELAALRIPNLKLVQEHAAAETPVETLRVAAERWRASRVSVAAGTAATYGVSLARILPLLGNTPPSEITEDDVAALVAKLAADGLARASIRKTRSALAMILDRAGVAPNPARSRNVELPREQKREVIPPERVHVEAALRLLPAEHRLATLVLDATGMRVGELEALTWGDVDEPERRWRVSAGVAKTRYSRWVPVDPIVFDAVMALAPTEDRELDGQLLPNFTATRYRSALTNACKKAAVPHFSPHDLRHRRATLWHLQGVPAAQAASWLGHSPVEHLRTYAHAMLVDRTELDYASWFESNPDFQRFEPHTKRGTTGDTTPHTLVTIVTTQTPVFKPNLSGRRTI